MRNGFFSASVVFLFSILTAGLIAESILVTKNSSLVDVYDSVPDEILFFIQAKKLSSIIGQLDVVSIKQFGVPYGYGFPFWITAAGSILAFPDPQEGFFGLAPHKFLFLLFKWISIFWLSALLLIKRGALAAAVFCLSFISCSAFAFYGKVFSPEPLVFLLSALALGFVAIDQFRLGFWMHAAVISSIFAVSIKGTALPIIALVFVIIICKGFEKKRALVFLFQSMSVASTLGFFSIFSDEGLNSFVIWSKANANRVFELRNIASWFGFSGQTWEYIPLSGVSGFAGIVVALAYLAIAVLRTGVKLQKWALISCLIGLSGAVLTIGMTGYLDWYLWPSTLLILFSCAQVQFEPAKKDVVILFIASLLVLFISIPETSRRVSMRQSVINELEKAKQEGTNKLDSLVECNSKAIILTDLFIGFRGREFKLAKVIRVRDAITLAGSTVPIGPTYFSVPPAVLISNGSLTLPNLDEVTHIIINDDAVDYFTSPLKDLVGVKISPNKEQASFRGSLFTLVSSLDGRSLYKAFDYVCDE